MSEKVSDSIVQIFVIAYVALCIAVVLLEFKENRISNAECVKLLTEVIEEENTDQLEMTRNENVQLPNAAANASATFSWLEKKEGAQAKVLKNFAIEESLKLDSDQLASLVDSKYYIKQGKIKNTGIYMPLAMLTYIGESGTEIIVVYSFSNAQFEVYADGKQIESGLLYNPDNLYNLMESINR